MQIKSILKRVQLHPGFIYDAVRWRDPRTRMILDIEIRPRKGSWPVCTKCGRSGPVYDLRLVSCSLRQAVELERGCQSFSHHLGFCLPVGGGSSGSDTSQSRRSDLHRH